MCKREREHFVNKGRRPEQVQGPIVRQVWFGKTYLITHP